MQGFIGQLKLVLRVCVLNYKSCTVKGFVHLQDFFYFATLIKEESRQREKTQKKHEVGHTLRKKTLTLTVLFTNLHQKTRVKTQ